MKLGKSTLIGVILIAMLIGSTGGIYFLVLNRGGTINVSPKEQGLPSLGESYNLTLMLAKGDKLDYDLYILISQPTNKTEDRSSLNMVVSGFQWPDIEVIYKKRGGNESVGTLTYTNIALPLEDLGRESISVPVFIPVVSAAVCMKLELKGTTETPWGRAYRYDGSIDVGGSVISVGALYLQDSGVLASINMTLNDNEKGTLAIFKQKLADMEINRQKTIVSTPKGWFCKEGYSSDFTFVYDGLIRIENGIVYKASVEEVLDALRGTTVFMVLSKSCPHCHNNWPHILEASKHLDMPLYAIVIGALTTEREWKLGVNEASKAGVLGTPSFIVYKDGRIVAVKEGETPWQELVKFIKDNTR